MKGYDKSEVFDVDILENGNPVENLTYLSFRNSDQTEANYRSSEPKFISGIGDIIQVHAQHAINAPYSLLAINLKLINLNRFVIDRIKIRALHPNNLELYPTVMKPKIISVETLSPNETHNVSFSFSVQKAVSANVTFELTLEIGEIEDIVRFITLPYSVSFLEFLVPNYMMATHQMVFENIWQNIPYNFNLKCRLLSPEKQLLQALRKNKFYASTFTEQEGWNKIYMLAYTWDSNSVAAIIKNEAYGIITENPMISIEIRSSNMKIIENIKEDENSFVNLLGREKLGFLY